MKGETTDPKLGVGCAGALQFAPFYQATQGSALKKHPHTRQWPALTKDPCNRNDASSRPLESLRPNGAED